MIVGRFTILGRDASRTKERDNRRKLAGEHGGGRTQNRFPSWLIKTIGNKRRKLSPSQGFEVSDEKKESRGGK